MSYTLPATTTYQPNEICHSEHMAYAVPAFVAAGQQLKKGTVMGVVTSSGLLKAYASANTDGSQIPWGILKENIDTVNNGGNPAMGALYIRGVFLTPALTGLDSNALSVRSTWLSNTALGLLIL